MGRGGWWAAWLAIASGAMAFGVACGDDGSAGAGEDAGSDAGASPDGGEPPRDGGPDVWLPPLPGRDGGGPACAEPLPETCDGTDEDCDHRVDEDYVLSCSRCADDPERCIQGVVIGAGFRVGLARNLQVGGDLGIRLPPPPGRNEYIYIANSTEDTVSKLRASDGVEVGRFMVGDNPSRTAVDGDGNAWVAMRGSASSGPDGFLENVVKIDGACTPVIAPPVPTRECILLDVAGVGETLRGVAVDARGDVWIGSFATQEVIHLDGQTGRALGSVALESFGANPYGIAIDENGYLWVASRFGTARVLRVDTERLEVDRDFVLGPDDLTNEPYGIASDGAGGMWFGSHWSTVFRVDALTGEVGPTYELGGTTRGVAFDDAGEMWIADSGLDRALRVDPATGAVEVTATVGLHPVGVAVDHDGNVWVVNQNSEDATKLAPDGTVLGTYPVGGVPYTYSDMTGSAFRVFRNLRGVFQATYDTGIAGAQWTGVTWSGEAPPPSTVALRVRADDDDPSVAEWHEVALDDGPAVIALTGGRLEVELALTTDDRDAIPFVRSLSFTFRRP